MDLGEEIRTELIRECSKRLGDEFEDSIYDECLKAIKETDLSNIANLESTMRRFLYVWGRMGRVLGRYDYRNWESKLAKQIELDGKELEEFRTKDLLYVNLHEYEPVIKKCYGSFKEAVGAIAAAKTLHLICPSFFPLWDNAIANAVRKERADKKNGEFSPADYYSFMVDMQRFLKEYDQVLSALASKYKRGKLRILDEFLWWMAHRPLSLFLH